MTHPSAVRRSRSRLLPFALLVAVLWLAAAALPPARAQQGAAPASPDAYTIPWYTIDGGGGTSAGAPYTLRGTAGQPDAGVLTGGGYTLTGGFWLLRQARGAWLPLVTR